jgi:hypothetical protein
MERGGPGGGRAEWRGGIAGEREGRRGINRWRERGMERRNIGGGREGWRGIDRWIERGTSVCIDFKSKRHLQ